MELDVCSTFMGLKDHLDDGIGILDRGLDLDYLHVESTDRQPDVITPWAPAKAERAAEGKAGEGGACSSSTSSSSSSSEEEEEDEEEREGGEEVSAGSEGEAERVGPGGENEGGAGSAPSRSPAPDPGQTDPSPEEPKPPDALREYRTKMEFALKLGYAEELVRLVLGKLGPDALINDILGELVKLGSKVESEQGGSSAATQSSSSSCCASSLASSSSMFLADSDSHRADTPPLLDLLDDEDNLRPVVLDGSNVAMR